MRKVITLTVKLKNGSLYVDQTGDPNHIPPGQSVKITWHLAGDGTFNPISSRKDSGFTWVNTPKTGIFKGVQVMPGGKEITLTDDNTLKDSTGEWVYQLCATINEKPYSTITIPPI